MPVRPRGPRSIRAVVAALLGATLLVACGDGGEPRLEIGEAQAAPPIAGSSQIVVDVTNTGEGDDRLVAATTPAALGVEVHETTIEDDRAVMRERDDVELPAGETVSFRPGHLHLMLVVPDQTVTVGASFDLTLEFDRSEPITVPVEVVELLELVDDPDELVDGLDDPDA
jgi:periplasmic copper chaperone A